MLYYSFGFYTDSTLILIAMTQYSQRNRKRRNIYDPNAPQNSFPDVDDLLYEPYDGTTRTIRGRKAAKQKGYFLNY